MRSVFSPILGAARLSENPALDIVWLSGGSDVATRVAAHRRRLTATSPALGFAVGGSCLPIDELGVKRPQGSGCDSGAYESNV